MVLPKEKKRNEKKKRIYECMDEQRGTSTKELIIVGVAVDKEMEMEKKEKEKNVGGGPLLLHRPR